MGSNTSTVKPIRIMMVGDSMTHGQEGDYTWRYRFWQWLTDQDISFQLVGPWTGTMAPTKPGEEPGEGPRAFGGYAKDVDKRFTGHHFSAWGRAVCQDMDIIKDEVTTHKPDLLLVMLGFNDLGWFISDADGTFESMKTFVKSARAANPNIKLALADIPQRRFMDGRQDLVDNTNKYNDMLSKAVPEWSSAQSPIRLVKLCKTYQCKPDACPAGYDGLHPNALGDYQIARAFSSTMVEDFELGAHALKVPSHIPSRPVSVPRNVKAFSRNNRVKLTWDRVYGAYGYDVQHRKLGTKDWELYVKQNERHDVMLLHGGEVMELRVRMTCGEECCSDWSDIVSAAAS